MKKLKVQVSLVSLNLEFLLHCVLRGWENVCYSRIVYLIKSVPPISASLQLYVSARMFPLNRLVRPSTA